MSQEVTKFGAGVYTGVIKLNAVIRVKPDLMRLVS